MLNLPPGNAPAPEVGDDPRVFPSEFWEQEWWPWLWPKVVLPYADAAARNADLAGLGPSERAVAFLEDSKTLWRWDGTAWALAAPWTQQGVASLPGNATDSRNVAVTFPVAFTAAPYVLVQAVTGASDISTDWRVWPSSITTAGFTLFGFRNNTTTMSVRWVAGLTP